MNKKIKINYLYLDVSVCTRCQGSDLNLEKAVESLKTIFSNYDFNLSKIHIDTIDLALKEKFVSSPTIRIDGKELPIEFKENNCDSCGDFCGDNVDCRIWVHNGEEYESAPTEMLIELISDYINGKNNLLPLDSKYTIPENIIHFFSARLNKGKSQLEVQTGSCCSSNSNCC